jgi:two-component system response regulator YesN
MNSSLIKERLKNWNIYYQHPSYALERKLLSEVKMGLMDESNLTLSEINALERAVLSKNPTRSMKNSLIASCTLFTRAVIEAGVDPEDAFALSDVFINHIEVLEQMKDLEAFEYEMLSEFIKLSKKKKSISFPYPVIQMIKYINENTTEKITLATLSHLTSKSPDYLSKLFKKEVGSTLTFYIQQQKIEAAKYYLEYTSAKITEIANMLEFSNSAHFSKVFKQYTGLSPSYYQRRSVGL